MIGTLDYSDTSIARKRILEFSLLKTFEPWPFARLADEGVTVSMRLSEGIYWRDCGAWGVGFEVKDGRVFAKASCKNTTHLDGLEFFEISEEEWAKENVYEPPDVCCCGDSMENHPSPMECGHMPVSAREYYGSPN